MTAARVQSGAQALPRQSEKSFTEQVRQYALLNGWLYFHVWRSVHSPAGFPDCVFVRPPWAAGVWDAINHYAGTQGEYPTPEQWADMQIVPRRIVVAELKRIGEQPTAEQCQWLESLARAGIPAYLWTPADWPELEQVLGRR